MSAEDAEEREMEMQAIEAIYDQDARCDRAASVIEVHVPDRAHPRKVVLRAHLPCDYPSTAGPVLEFLSPHLDAAQREWCSSGASDLVVPGASCIYPVAEWLREQEHLWATDGAEPADGDPGGGKLSEEQEAELAAAVEKHCAFVDDVASTIITGEPFTERKSTFQAHVCPVKSAAEVDAFVEALFRNNKVRNATHNILAYRIWVDERQAWLQDCDDGVGPDDPGEDAAGGRLLHLMQVADVKDCAVVVTRWYGGVLLGPSRFALINNAARQLLEQTGYIVQKAGKAGRGK
ncbi:unnamed protein product [Pedinophyceae sp. YPF-701]|nr:unnamed protein product [Pedinophyceae sp. YPF-701]